MTTSDRLKPVKRAQRESRGLAKDCYNVSVIWLNIGGYLVIPDEEVEVSVLVGIDVRFLSADFIFGDFHQRGGYFRALVTYVAVEA